MIVLIKTRIFSVVIATLLVAVATVNFAEDAVVEGNNAVAKGEEVIRVQVEYIDVSQEHHTELMAGARESCDDSVLRQKVGELVRNQKATVVETMICVGKSRQKSTTDSVHELIYPIEYESPALPESGGYPNKTIPWPTAWDTRNVDSTLEIEPELYKDREWVDLRLSSDIVYHAKTNIWAEWRDEHTKADLQSPVFYAVRVNTSVYVEVGKPLMVATLSPMGEDGLPDRARKVMVFVRCEVLDVSAKEAASH